MFRFVCSDSLCCSVYCLCVNVYCTNATGCQPNCSYVYIISYHIISYHIISYHIISYQIGCWGKYFRRRRTRWHSRGGNCILMIFMICNLHRILFENSNQEEWDGRDMWHVWRREEQHTGILGNSEWKRTLGCTSHRCILKFS
jgi:hypothetical protein